MPHRKSLCGIPLFDISHPCNNAISKTGMEFSPHPSSDDVLSSHGIICRGTSTAAVSMSCVCPSLSSSARGQRAYPSCSMATPWHAGLPSIQCPLLSIRSSTYANVTQHRFKASGVLCLCSKETPRLQKILRSHVGRDHRDCSGVCIRWRQGQHRDALACSRLSAAALQCCSAKPSLRGLIDLTAACPRVWRVPS